MKNVNCSRESLLLYAVTDRRWLGDHTLHEQMENAIKGGVTFVLLREKTLDREAFLKAAGTGLREPFALREIEAVRLESGAPAYRFSGATARWVADHGLTAHLSLSHDGGMALAFCILETAPET